MTRRISLLFLVVLLSLPAAAATADLVGRLGLGFEFGGSLSVGELLPIEFKPAPDAEWSIIVPVPLYPGNGLDIGATVDYSPVERLNLRAWWGSQIPLQPQAALPSYLDEVSGSFHRFGLDVLTYLTVDEISVNLGLGGFYILAGYEFLFDDFTTEEEDWERISGDTWTAGLTPQLGVDLRFGQNFVLGGRILAPISLVSNDDNTETDDEGYGNDGDGLELRLHIKYFL